MDGMSGTTMPTGTSVTMSTVTSTRPTPATTTSAMTMGTIGANGAKCKISMLWNWNTVDACFISPTWQISSDGHFAGSCIGVILLVMALELLRRTVKEYDRYLIRNHLARVASSQCCSPPLSSPGPSKNGDAARTVSKTAAATSASVAFRPSVIQQSIRALLHMMQFALAYFIMLLAMYYNGYFIICIFIGAYLGSFVFQWETLSDGRTPTSAVQEATVCCG